jgi:hypothetical protein
MGGWLGVPPRVWVAVGAVALALLVINATTDIMEATREGAPLSAWLPFLWETTSALVILALLPAVGAAERRLRPARIGWPLSIAGHGLALLVFSAVHVSLMVALRSAVMGLAGSSYDFGPVGREFLYELRKDALTYVALLAAFVLLPRLPLGAAPAPAPVKGGRIEIREGERRLWLPPSDILWIEAAGNYVELFTASRSHLVRGTLAGFEQQLAGQGFVRVHRSRLVNAAHVRAVETKPSGDFTVTLDGRSVAGSRRFRAALLAAAPGAVPAGVARP